MSLLCPLLFQVFVENQNLLIKLRLPQRSCLDKITESRWFRQLVNEWVLSESVILHSEFLEIETVSRVNTLRHRPICQMHVLKKLFVVCKNLWHKFQKCISHLYIVNAIRRVIWIHKYRLEGKITLLQIWARPNLDTRCCSHQFFFESSELFLRHFHCVKDWLLLGYGVAI